MAAACYERKVSDVLMGCKLQDYVDIQQHDLSSLTAASVLDAVAAAATSPTSSSTSPISGVVSSSPTSNTGYKDYSQPLHVDCSVEYELPSQTKPPPGGGEPLLMIHPCYYRRAERERRSIFVNNLPPRGSSSSSSQSRRSSSRRNAAAIAAAAAAAAASTAPNTSSSSVVTATTAPAAVAAAAATYHAALTAAASLVHHQEQKPAKIQVVGATATDHAVQPDEKAVLASIYPHYFRSIRSHSQHLPHQTRLPEQQIPATQASLHIHHRHIPHQHHQHQTNSVSSSTVTPLANVLRQAYQPQQQTQQPQQQSQPQYANQTSHLMTSRHQNTVGSTAATTVLGHHPYRRPADRGAQIRSSGKQTSMSTNSSLSAAAAVTVATSGMSSNVYASAIHRHHAIHALQANGFYEAPVYHALLPQS